MKGSVLPEAIQKAVGTEKHTVDKIGESTSEVRIYDNYVISTEQTPISNCGKATLISQPSTSRSSICVRYHSLKLCRTNRDKSPVWALFCFIGYDFEPFVWRHRAKLPQVRSFSLITT